MILIDKIINANSNGKDGNLINEQDKQSIEQEQEAIHEVNNEVNTTNFHEIRILLLEKLAIYTKSYVPGIRAIPFRLNDIIF